MYLKVNKETRVIYESRSSAPYPEEEGFESLSEEGLEAGCAGGTLDAEGLYARRKTIKRGVKPVVKAMKALDPDKPGPDALKTIIEFLQR